MKDKVAITTTSFAEYDTGPLHLLSDKGLDIVTNTLGRKLERKEILEICSGCIGIVAGTEIYDSNALAALKGLKVISRCGTGMENIDMDTANKMDIKLFNTPNVPTVAVAELTLGLILNLLRKINRMDQDIKEGKWGKLMGNLLSGKKVGIIGFGRIGQKVGELINSFGTEIAYCDIQPKLPSFYCLRMNMNEILKWADIVTLHLSASGAKQLIIGSKELLLMKKGSWIINTSRGEIIDEKALYNLLKDNYFSGVALDVFGWEPYAGPLIGLDNVILTPHIGSYARESRIRMEKEAAENLIKGLGLIK